MCRNNLCHFQAVLFHYQGNIRVGGNLIFPYAKVASHTIDISYFHQSGSEEESEDVGAENSLGQRWAWSFVEEAFEIRDLLMTPS